jgi:hypothetical protein
MGLISGTTGASEFPNNKPRYLCPKKWHQHKDKLRNHDGMTFTAEMVVQKQLQ